MGILVKAILTASNLLLRVMSTFLFSRSPSTQPPRSILVFRTSLLGDFICAIPALVVLRQRYPTARIGLLTIPSTNRTVQKSRDILLGGVPEWLSFVAPSLVDSVFTLTVSGASRTVVTQELRRFISELNPDVSLILPFSGDGMVSKGKKLAFLRLAGVTKHVYGWQVHATAGLLRDAQFRMGLFDHQVIAPLKALQEYVPSISLRRDDIRFALAVPKDAETFAENIWKERGWGGKTVIAVSPGGAFDHKRWPAENFITLCGKIAREWDADFVALGLEGERDVGGKLSSALGQRALNLMGRTSILQAAAILQRCSLFIGNDSGLAHLASALGCSTVTVMYSVVYPGIWEPWNDIKSAVRHSVPCEHCFSYLRCPTGTQECIKGIRVSTVLDRCNELLARQSVPQSTGLAAVSPRSIPRLTHS